MGLHSANGDRVQAAAAHVILTVEDQDAGAEVMQLHVAECGRVQGIP